MFIRKKKNQSGSISVQILKKERGKSILIETIGCSNDFNQIKKLEQKANDRIDELLPQQCFDFTYSQEDQIITQYFNSEPNIQVYTIGPELILGKIFDTIGFNVIQEELFRHIVLARLVYPVSKLKTTDYLLHYNRINIDVEQIYRFLDRFYKKYKSEVERIVYEHTKKILQGKISMVFYDMTTLYFEAENEDDLRKIGFSKDGKFQCPQIMLGLLVGENGLPIGYDVFEGNKFEGHTLMPIIEQIQKKYGFPKPIVIADSGLLSKDNLDKLSEQKYEFILGARIKNETEKIKKEILEKSKDLINEESIVIIKPDGLRLIINYSDQRAKKDAYNREKGLKKLRQQVSSGKLTKESINNRGYNKFLQLDNEVNVSIDETKINEDKKWDGLKGYITNSNLSPKDIISNYKHLWQIEKAFRISKTDLRIRPVYHRKRDRIEAHLCIAFVAYAVYKELERLLINHKVRLSPAKAIELTKTIYQLEFLLPESNKTKKILANLLENQKLLLKICNSLPFG